MRTYRTQKEYTFIIFPLVLFFLSSGAYDIDFNSIRYREILLIIITILLWYTYLFLPHKIEIEADNKITFHSILHRKTLEPNQIELISKGNFLTKFKHKDGTIIITTLVDGIGSLISFINTNSESTIVKEDNYEHPLISKGNKSPWLLFVSIIFATIATLLIRIWSISN